MISEWSTDTFVALLNKIERGGIMTIFRDTIDANNRSLTTTLYKDANNSNR